MSGKSHTFLWCCKLSIHYYLAECVGDLLHLKYLDILAQCDSLVVKVHGIIAEEQISHC
jgi:hypothetical protein